MADANKLSFETRCVHAGVTIDDTFNSCTTPIYPTSTFYWEDLETTKGFDYTRSGNPTRRAMENNIATLEGGTSCRATSTGMSAITALMHLFSPGDQIIAAQDIYGGTYRLFDDIFTKMGITFAFVDMCDPANVQAAVTDKTKGIWIETPSNPLMRLTDIEAVVAIAKQCGAITIADNTFLSPYLQRPFELGVDIVMHSTTKYLNGHSDVVGGCIVTKTEAHSEKIDYLVNAMGLGCSPFDAWLVLRGVKTLGPRMEAHQRGAMAIARFLDGHPNVDRVYYPGLESHPQYELANETTVRLRSDAQFRGQRRQIRHRASLHADQTLHAGRIIGRRRILDLRSRLHDALIDGRIRTPQSRHHRTDDPSVGRDRKPRRPDRRHETSAGRITPQTPDWGGTGRLVRQCNSFTLRVTRTLRPCREATRNRIMWPWMRGKVRSRFGIT